jgi:3-oxoacyl-[acyl-carrier protein] reductase
MVQGRVLVTGSSRGIGRAIALALAADGWSIGVHHSGEGGVDETCRSLGKMLAGAYDADFSDPRNARALVREVLRDGPVQALVNNAGVYLPLDFLGSGEAAFEANMRRTLSVNFESPLVLMREFAQTFASQGGGKILNVASRVGFKGEGGAALYAASKGALINVTRSLAVELAPKNIQLFGIAPGWTATAMAREGMEERLEEILSGIPVGRMATPEDCANAARFLLSPGAEYLSGVVIDINGASYFH